MNQIRVGHLEADGALVNLVLGFVPAYIKVVNINAATGEIGVVEWFSEMGDNKELQWIIVADNGTTANTIPKYVSSGGIVSEYNTTSVQTSDPVQVLGGEGVTIAAAFMDDGDEVYYFAVMPDRDVDAGDINA